MPQIPNIMPVDPVALITQLRTEPPTVPVDVGTQRASFSDMLLNGVKQTNARLLEAEQLVSAFATDDSIPVHQVTYALEQSRQSLELVMQVRGRLLDAYQQFMGMQL